MLVHVFNNKNLLLFLMQKTMHFMKKKILFSVKDNIFYPYNTYFKLKNGIGIHVMKKNLPLTLVLLKCIKRYFRSSPMRVTLHFVNNLANNVKKDLV